MNRINRMIELARGHVEREQGVAAEIYYRMVLKDTDPPKTGTERLARGEACMWFARKARYHQTFGEAVDWYMKAVEADPLAIDYRIEYVIRALLPMGMMKNARIEAERTTRIEPDNKEAWRALAGVEQALGNTAACIAAYDKQLELDPKDLNARIDRATIALDTADYVTVREMCEPVLGTDREADALHVLAMAEYREARHEAAIALYDKAIAANCYDPPLAEWNKSLALHAIGRYKEGWKAHEARGRQKTDLAMALVMKRFQAPMWAGEPPPVRLHVHQEMGFGDAIAMARYVPILANRGYNVRFEVNDSLAALFHRSFPGVTVIGKALDYPGALGLPPFDYHVPALSLPHLLGTDVDTVPWSGRYLEVDRELADFYQGRLSRKHLAVGLCWSSGIRHDGLWISEYGRRKSMPLRDLYNGIVKSGTYRRYRFYSLQVGPEREETADCPPWFIRDILPPKPTWDNTAALIENLDLVITVDTAVAHLAGAMGKPVWIMMQRDGASWHFMCYRPDAPWNEASPWYPSARIFRQREFNVRDWGGVVDDVARALRKLDADAHRHSNHDRERV